MGKIPRDYANIEQSNLMCVWFCPCEESNRGKCSRDREQYYYLRPEQKVGMSVGRREKFWR